MRRIDIIYVATCIILALAIAVCAAASLSILPLAGLLMLVLLLGALQELFYENKQ